MSSIFFFMRLPLNFANQMCIRDRYQAEELRKLQNRNKAKASQKTNVQQVELSLF